VASVAPPASAAASAAAAIRALTLIRGIFMIAFPLCDAAAATQKFRWLMLALCGRARW
jgi:hypothetical protein